MGAYEHKSYMAADLRGPLNVCYSTATSISTGINQPGARDEPMPAVQIVALLVASGVSQQFDLQATGFFGSAKYQERFVRMISETAGAFHYAWAQATGASIDRTATGGGTGVAAWWPSATPTDELPAGRWLNIQPASSGIIRLWITNRSDGY